jgi:hypothetical protein
VTRLKWKLNSVHLEIVLIFTQDRCTLCAEYVLDAPDVTTRRLGVMWSLVSVRLEIVLVSVQDMCTVWANHTVGSKIILDAPKDTPR